MLVNCKVVVFNRELFLKGRKFVVGRDWGGRFLLRSLDMHQRQKHQLPNKNTDKERTREKVFKFVWNDNSSIDKSFLSISEKKVFI